MSHRAYSRTMPGELSWWYIMCMTLHDSEPGRPPGRPELKEAGEAVLSLRLQSWMWTVEPSAIHDHVIV